MVIKLRPSDALKISRAFGFKYPPSSGHGIMLPGDAGALERPAHFKFEWIGTESELVRLSKKLGVLRTANPLDVSEWVTMKLPPHKHVARPNPECPYCRRPVKKFRKDSECRASWGRGQFYHQKCFNIHRKHCNACWMMTGPAGR